MADKRPIVDPVENQRLQPGDRLAVESVVSASTLTFESSTTGPLTFKSLDDAISFASGTGLIIGGLITVNGGDPSKFDVSAGTGHIIDTTTTPGFPIRKPVSWLAFTTVTLTHILTDIFTSLLIDDTGALVQEPAGVTSEQRRTHIVLGAVTHPDHLTIGSISYSTCMAAGAHALVRDFIDLFGQGNINGGNSYSANGPNMNVDKSAGSVFAVSSNRITDPLNPNITTVPLSLAITLLYQHRDGSGGFTLIPSASAISGFWDDGSGTLAVVPPNKFVIQRLDLAASIPLTVASHGQVLYNSLPDAEAAIKDSTVTNTDLNEQGVFRAWLILRDTTTNLQTAADAKFINTPEIFPRLGL